MKIRLQFKYKIATVFSVEKRNVKKRVTKMAYIAIGLYAIILGCYTEVIFGQRDFGIALTFFAIVILGGVTTFFRGWILYIKTESKEGRIGRLDYFVRNLLIGLLTGFALMAVSFFEPSTGTRMGFFFIWLSGALALTFQAVMRLHDIDRPAIQCLLLFVPLYNIYFQFLLWLKVGTKGSNQYGNNPLEIKHAY